MSGEYDPGEWLQSLGLGQHYELFRSHDIDMRALPYLTDGDLVGLELSLGHRRILLAAIGRLSTDDSGRFRSPRPFEMEAERRPLSIMFCDLVGSTALSRRMDPEDMKNLLYQYQARVSSAVVRYGGYVAKFQGDGIVAYFGWPEAYEDQAERAVRAGL